MIGSVILRNFEFVKIQTQRNHIKVAQEINHLVREPTSLEAQNDGTKKIGPTRYISPIQKRKPEADSAIIAR